MKVIALVDLPNRRVVGEIFETSDQEGRLLIYFGQAAAAATHVIIDDAHVHTSRELQEAMDAAPGRRRQYRRRDLTAESSED